MLLNVWLKLNVLVDAVKSCQLPYARKLEGCLKKQQLKLVALNQTQKDKQLN